MALEIPAAVVKPLTLNRLYLGTIVGMHLLGLLACLPCCWESTFLDKVSRLATIDF